MTDEEYDSTRSYLILKYGGIMAALRLLNETDPSKHTKEHKIIDKFIKELFYRAHNNE